MTTKIAVLLILIVIVLAVYLILPESRKSFPPASFDDAMNIAPLEEALTFARATGEGSHQLILVRSYSETSINGYNLTTQLESAPTDPVDLFSEFGFDALQDMIEALPESSQAEYPIDSLITPLALTDEHVAAGTNFAAHADESSVEDGPFLFAKQVKPTAFNAPVHLDEGLLDYEAELAYVTLADTAVNELPEYMGLILSNDFTNRAKLLRHVNTDDVTSGDGFTTGKSAPGFLPVGNLFVIPKDYRSFSKALTLELAVNEKLRQSGSMDLVIWDIDELFHQIDRWKEIRWEYLGEQVGLPVKENTLPARTLILAGTPDGTIFQGPTTKIMVKGALRFLFGGWNRSVTDNVIEHYISAAEKQGHYLSPGDKVHIRVDRMGEILTEVE